MTNLPPPAGLPIHPPVGDVYCEVSDAVTDVSDMVAI